MKIYKKYSTYYIYNMLCIFCSIVLSYALITESAYAQFFGGNSDFLEQVFSPSKAQQQVINIGNDKTAVGNEVFRPSLTVQIDDQGIQTPQRPPLLVRITKFLLRLTIVLSVTMTIFTGIRYILSLGRDDVEKNSRKYLLFIVFGILLAMLSYSIIILLQSITFSTLSGI